MTKTYAGLTALKLFLCLIVIQPLKSSAQVTVTLSGEGSVICPATPTAAYSTPPAGVSFSTLTRGSGVACASAANGLSGARFNAVSPLVGYSANSYYKVTITAAATHDFVLSSITWLTELNDEAAETKFSIRYQIDGGPFNNFGSLAQDGTTTNTFTGSIAVNAGSSLNIYAIPSNAVSAGGTVQFKNGSTFVIASTPIPLPPVVTGATVNGAVGTPLSYFISATNSPTGYAIASGVLPAGLSLNTVTGEISGTPEAAGSSSVNVTARNSGGTSSPATINFIINDPTFTPFDDFERRNSNALGYPSSGAPDPWVEPADNFAGQSKIYNNRFDIVNNSTQGVVYDYYDMRGIYTTIFANAARDLTWLFNMRTSRADPGGFGTGDYGTAFIIGSDNANLATGGNGYAVVYGESHSGDKVRLVKFTGGIKGTLTDIITNSLTPENGLLNIRVDFNPCTASWTLSVNNSGVPESDEFDFTDPTTVDYTATGSAIDNTYITSNLKYLGALSQYGTADGEYSSFDNIYIPADLSSANTYTWNGTTPDYQVSTNWTPARGCARITDVLQFTAASPASSTVTNVPSQTIAQLLISGNRTVTFKDAASDVAASTLIIGGASGADFSVEAGSSFIFDVASSNNASDGLILNLLTATTGSISGNLIFRNSNSGTAGRPHQLLAIDANSITVNSGGIIKAEDLNGDPFGSSSLTPGIINFLSGAAYESYDGSNPFTLSQPASKVTFNRGSVYRHKQSSMPSLFGRIYANFEFDISSYTANINFGSAAAMTVDTLKILNGTVNVNGTASAATNFNIKGDMKISSGAVFSYDPLLASTISFKSGTSVQKINNSGTLIFGKKATVEINNTAAATPKVSVETDIEIQGTLKVTAGELNLSTGNITLKSDAIKTADLAAVTGSITYGTGKFIIERYISAQRKWNFLGINTTGGTLSVQNSWMETQTPGITGISGKGTWITDPAGTASGFDAASYSASMKYWNGADYTNITDPRSFNIRSHPAYMIFIRGDRNSTNTGAGASITNATVLRTKGEVNVGTLPAVPVTAGNDYTPVTNPYPAAVDLSRIITVNNDVLQIAVWDPNLSGSQGLGAFQTLTRTSFGTDFTITPGGGSYPALIPGSVMNTLESGQAFFVQSSANPNSIQFRENCKTAQSHSVFRTAQQRIAGQEEQLAGRLYIRESSGSTLMDGFRIIFDPAYSNAADLSDAKKMANTNENVSVKKGTALIAVELRNLVTADDTVYINMSGLRAAGYQWKFNLDNMDVPARVGYLVDKHTNARTPLNLNGENVYDFSVTATAAGSYAPDRFMIVFKQSAVVPVTFMEISAQRMADKTVQVKWKAENEMNIDHYEIQRSSNGASFVSIGTENAHNNAGGAAAYLYNDQQPFWGINYYRIKSAGQNGELKYSSIVKVLPESRGPEISVSPNPVKDKTLRLQMTDQPSGVYSIQLINNAGQLLYKGTINITGGNIVKNILLPNEVASGNYKLIVKDANGKKQVVSILIQ